jgi:perosamine synthetase
MPDQKLALLGGSPVRERLLPYGRQSITKEDIAAVTKVLKSDFLTTGTEIAAFEKEFAGSVLVKEAIAVNNGTSALHTALYGAGIQKGDEVIVPAITFAATANAVVMQGGVPVFADCDPLSLQIDPTDVERKITKKTKAIIAVDYTGQPCDYDELRKLAKNNNLILIADACHALGATYKSRPVGALADISTFSFHPVKPLTTGEGGMVVTENSEWAAKMRRFRNHNMSIDAMEREKSGGWFYAIEDLGYNYRLTDFQCALGRSQLPRVPAWTKRRQEIAKKYDAAFENVKGITHLTKKEDRTHAYHLYILLIDPKVLADRDTIFKALRAENIGVNVHYIPAHLHPFYQNEYKTKKGMCPVAEDAFERMITLPLFASMTDKDCKDVIAAVEKVCHHFEQ